MTVCFAHYNRRFILKSLGINPADIVADGPFRQSKTSVDDGCQIDYLIQTRTNNLFICEFKFRRKELSMEMINELKSKIKALKVPRGFACVPVLFHIGGVSESLATSDYFYRIIDIAEFLQ